MKKESIDITLLVTQVNTMYEQGFTSLEKIEKELGYGKGSIKKRLNRNKYAFNKQLKQYVLQANTTTTQATELNNTIDNTLCYEKNEDTYNPAKESTGGIKIKPKQQDIFTQEEILFIKDLYKKHTLATQLITQDNNTNEEELITRSIRVDKNVIDTFAKYCKNNNIKQSTALKIALQNFIKNS